MVEAEGQRKNVKSRLSDEQKKKAVQGRAIAFRRRVVVIAHRKAQRNTQFAVTTARQSSSFCPICLEKAARAKGNGDTA